MVAAEALARGLTVISTPVDGIVDYIIPGFNGYLLVCQKHCKILHAGLFCQRGTCPAGSIFHAGLILGKAT